MTRPALPLLVLLGLALPACGGDGDDSPDAGAASMDAGAAGAAKGETCQTTEDCADPAAVCRAGNLCTGPIDEVAFQIECASGGAADCPGLVCLGLTANVQGKTGICSMPCEADADCGADAVCVAFQPTRTYCLHLCATDADCANGFVCVDDPGGRGQACLVDTE